MRRSARHFWGNSDGAVAPTVALSLVALIAVGGIAFDYARMATLDTELQNAADQAALAAASQLDGEEGACERAVDAAREIITNRTLMANDGDGLEITIAPSAVCEADGIEITDDPAASIRFFEDKAATTPADTVTGANFVEVRVDTRRAKFALTPVVAAFSSGDLAAQARAGLGTALCKVPPLMICSPSPGEEVDWNAMRGRGLQAVAGAGWTPGGFGYLGPQDANSTQIGLAFQNPVFQCQGINTTEEVSTGAPAPAITAVNTRFDIYSMSSGGGSVLAPCLDGACPAALNVVKDLVRQIGAGECGLRNNHSSNMNNEGWHLVAANRRFRPVPNAATDPMRSFQTSGQPIDAMGLPRDNCHYTSVDPALCGNRLGDGEWARGDYFNKYHSARIAAYGTQMATMTRYETYRWEIDNSFIPNELASGVDGQRGVPQCTTGTPERDRRVMQVAVGENCEDLNGASAEVEIGTWLEVFFVEPGVPPPGRGNGDGGNEIYLEIIREIDPGGAAAQVIRRDVPYLVR
jgi:Flp pilus assembly protein TadG